MLLIEDLVTTGSSSLAAVAALRDSGAVVHDVLAIVQYGFAEAKNEFSAANVNLHTLTTFPVILAAALNTGRVTSYQYEAVSRWLENPYQWQNP